MSVDLHIHSTWSDGTDTPREIVAKAAKSNISAISITDHDTAEGTDEALLAGQNHGVDIIPGIEFSVEHSGRSMHLLGYFLDPNDRGLGKVLTKIQGARADRNLKIIAKLNGLGIDIEYEEVTSLSAIGQTGRPHIAAVLVEKKAVHDIDSAFRKYLKKGRAAYAERYVLQASEAISLIRKAGGLAVLAHPGSIDSSLKKIPVLLDELVPRGLDGIEMYYPIHTPAMYRKLTVIADNYDLVVTGGSDYHGAIRPSTGLADGQYLNVPDEVVDNLRTRLQKIHA